MQYQLLNFLDADESPYKNSYIDDNFKSLKAYCEIDYKNPSFLKCYGSKDDTSEDYIIVLKYAPMGSLRKKSLHCIANGMEKKLAQLHCIATVFRYSFSKSYSPRLS
ncbi:hypothetical protein C2G38_2160231 [Gigaspora rosea]|uniref:Protein kinase domain-containing protein n=1 Tax=Gigaspora rosea TaxID=44941 RepID=A0A397W1S2_9GLOM|nr:hypothetical protein C2G38_2160231 [Gigaspora rosea]